VGTIDQAIPRVGDAAPLPLVLEPRRRAERALLAVVLAEQDDDWQDRRRYVRPSTIAVIDVASEPD
jgi:hypothetical protein